MPSDFFSSLSAYARELQDVYSQNIGVSAWPEEQLKAPVSRLVEQAAQSLGIDEVRTLREVRAEAVGRPDVGVTIGGLLSGHIELKKPGKGANPEGFGPRDKSQWKRFKDLPNLLYTDGNDWAHFRSSERVGPIVRFSGDATLEGTEAVTERDAEKLLTLFREFLNWQPVVPTRPKALAKLLAPVCRLLRSDVEAALNDADSPLSHLADDWRRFFFPDATDHQFADAFAQILTYALLLARFSGASDLDVPNAARAIRSGHRLLSETLKVLGDGRAREQVATSLDVLERIITAVDPSLFQRADVADPWLYFYEDFLAEYDPKMRKDRGVYYTPWQVVQAQVRLVAQLLSERFDAAYSFVDESVVTLDPACGTGTYPLAALQHGLDTVAQDRGPGAASGAATRAARNMHAFELLVGPYAVAHLRLTQQITAAGGHLPEDGAHVYLTDTLESPHATPPNYLPFLYRELSDEHRRAQEVKRDTPVLVCIGNPPYDRQQARHGETVEQRKGGWVRFGDPSQDTVRSKLLDDFTDPLTEVGAGVHAKNLYNDYVYFWRWALWKVCEQEPRHGIVTFITASSYLRGPGFIGMRQKMREAFDELWILDLGGDNRGARKSDNVFAIETPVCIAVGVRHRNAAAKRPAWVHFTRIEGSEREKLYQLAGVEKFEDLKWEDCPENLTAPFLPVQNERFAAWPLLTDLFPWQENGVQFKRTWPIGETESLVRRRWETLMQSNDRGPLMRETEARHTRKAGSPFSDLSQELPPIADLAVDAEPLSPQRYAFRSFDRQWMLPDTRFCDRHRPTLQRAHDSQQLYLTSLLTEVLGKGPSAVATALMPDLHHFRGSFGGKHVIPLWRDSAARDANVTHGVLDVLRDTFGEPVTSEDLFAYAYALLGSPQYVEHFWEALWTPGPRLPITTEACLFREAAALGRKLIWLHTYGERFVPEGERRGRIPSGTTRIATGTATSPESYPEAYGYDENTQELRIGEQGRFSGVRPEVFNFSISGLEVVKSWLDYRMKDGAGKTSSELDDIRPRTWTFDDELLDLFWVLEATLALHPTATCLLNRVLEGDTLDGSVFPAPTDDERRGPGSRPVAAPTPLFDEPE